MHPKRDFSCIIALFLGLAAATGTLADEPAKAKAKDLQVLFVGNSQIYYNDLPRMVEAIAESAPEDRPGIKADRFVSGGASLDRLWNAGAGKGTARAKIVEKKWDFVILQEIYNVKPESINKYAPLFHELIQKNGSRTVLLSTASISGMYPKGFEELHDMHIALGKKLQVPVAAAGKAWLTFWGDQPTQEQRLYSMTPIRRILVRRLVHLCLHSLCDLDRTKPGGADPSPAETTGGHDHRGRGQAVPGSGLEDTSGCQSGEPRK